MWASDEKVREVTFPAQCPTAGDRPVEAVCDPVSVCQASTLSAKLQSPQTPLCDKAKKNQKTKKKPLSQQYLLTLFFSPQHHTFQNSLQTNLCFQGLRTSDPIGNNVRCPLPLLTESWSPPNGTVASLGHFLFQLLQFNRKEKESWASLLVLQMTS